MKTAFDILEVSPTDNDEDIKAAYLQKVRQYSPERCPEQFQAIRAAFESIQTKSQRLKYQLFHYDPPTMSAILEQALPPGTPQRPTEQLFVQTLVASLNRISAHG